MNKSQWSVLSIGSVLLGILFAQMSLMWKGYCDIFAEVDMANIFACVKGEINSAFVYVFFTLGLIFLLCSFFEDKKK